MIPPQEPCANRLLAALPAAERERLQAHLKCVDLVPGQVLCEPGVMQHHVYFPTDAIVSLDCLTDSGATAEVAVVGSEGVVGVSLFLGGDPARFSEHFRRTWLFYLGGAAETFEAAREIINCYHLTFVKGHSAGPVPG